ncbi:MAG: flagellar motor protein MotB [Spirochaetia bacterium]|jgi:chemotaxis protein MotB|nr:flagellar motor protein MotB [Spirochaetia bacterium]
MARERKKKCPPEGAPEWMVTFSDMTTLLLTFFVMMFTTATVDGSDIRLILSAFQGLGALSGGNTLDAEGKLAELGNNVMAMPSRQAGKSLDRARKLAVALLQPELKSKMVRVTEDERGVVISLSADAFFRPASAELNIDAARNTIQNISNLMKADEMKGRKFRIEGHTDSTPTDENGEWKSNWELSTARATSIIHYLKDFNVDEKKLQAAGFSDTVPMATNDTEEGRAYNRRVDIIILSDAHL